MISRWPSKEYKLFRADNDTIYLNMYNLCISDKSFEILQFVIYEDAY